MQEKSTNRESIPGQRRDIGKVALVCAIAAATLFSIVQRVLLNFRAGHMDEYDYLFVGKTLMENMEWPTYTYIFGSNFSWYLFGFAEQWLGGLAGARMVSALLGLVSLIGIYCITKAIWGCRKTAWVAVLLLAVQSGHIFTSKIATYDSVSFALFTLSLTPLFLASGVNDYKLSNRNSQLLLIAGALLLLGAVLAKYTTVAYVPFIGLALLLCSVRKAVYFSFVIGGGLVAFIILHRVDLKILYDIQISGIHGANATYKEIVSRVLNGTWLLLLPTIVALLHARSNRAADPRPLRILLWLLFFTAPLVIYHLQGRNLISLYKHLTYANAFLAISTAWLVMLLAQTKPWQTSRIFQYRTQILASLTLIYTAVNFHQLSATENGYPDMNGLLEHLQNSPTTQGRILSEDPYLFRYKAFGEIAQEEIKETTWLDNDNDGTYTLQDVNDAVWDRKFELILLTDAIHPESNNTLREILSQRGYELEYSQPYQLSPVMTSHTSGEISLYRRSEQMVTVEQ